MERLFQVAELAAILRVKPSTVYAWVKSRKIPHLRLGRLIRFNVNHIKKITGSNGNGGGSVPLQN